jgi:hypothetical protein
MCNRQQLRQQCGARDDHDRTRVFEDVVVVSRLPHRVERHRDRADLDGREKAVDHLGTVERHQNDSLFRPHIEPIPQPVTQTIDAFEQLSVSDAFVTALDRDMVCPAVGDMAIDKVRRDVEGRRKLHLATGSYLRAGVRRNRIMPAVSVVQLSRARPELAA